MNHILDFTIDSKEIIIPERKWPDVDVDVGDTINSEKGRDVIIQYLIEKYGHSSVARVGTVLNYSPKSLIKALGSVYNIPNRECLACTKEYDEKKSIELNYHDSPQVRSFFKKYPHLKDKVKRMIDAKSGIGIHAGGAVIADSNRGYMLNDYIPLQRTKKNGPIGTGMTKEQVEAVGLIKYDVLGLGTATKIHRAKEMIGYDPYRCFYEDGEDIEVFNQIAGKARHKNIFQFESELGRQSFRDLKPRSIIELSNASGLIRVMGSDEGKAVYKRYFNAIRESRENNSNMWVETLRSEIQEDRIFNAAMEIFRETYGVLIYQEQLAYLVAAISNGEKTFTDGDKARRELNKHGNRYGKLPVIQGSPDKLQAWHKAFMDILNKYFLPYLGKDGCDSDDPVIQDFINFRLTDDNRLPTPKSGIINWLITSSSYIFSILHSIAYAVNTYDLMYLKCHHPAVFWSVTLDSVKKDADKLGITIKNMKIENTKINLITPNVNNTNRFFAPSNDGSALKFCLNAIKGVDKASEKIIAERERNGPYKNPHDFVTRLRGQGVNKRVIQNLFDANAFADFGDGAHVHRDFLDEGKELNPLPDKPRDFRIREEAVLGTNITYPHQLQLMASRYPAMYRILEGSTESVIVRVLDVEECFSKRNTIYTKVTCECQRSFKKATIYDFNNGRDVIWKKDTYRLLQVKRVANFYQI